jgi:hypothetical protein
MRIRPAVHGPIEVAARRRAMLAGLGIVAMVIGVAASAAQLYDFLFSERTEGGAPTIVLPELPAPVIIVPGTPGQSQSTGATAPVSGSWSLHTIVEQTTHRPFDGLHCVYRINLIEKPSGEVSGSGELWSENGEEVTGLNHILINFAGHHDGFELRLGYQLAGRSRPSTGALVLQFDEASMSWVGAFDSGVAASSGPARLEPR